MGLLPLRVELHCLDCRTAAFTCPHCAVDLNCKLRPEVAVPAPVVTTCAACHQQIRLYVLPPSGQAQLDRIEFLERCLISEPTTPTTRAGKVHRLDPSTQRWLQQHLRGPQAAAHTRTTWAACSVVIADWQQPEIPASVAAAAYRRVLNLDPLHARSRGPAVYSAGELIAVLTELGRSIPDGIRRHCPDLWDLHLELQASYARTRPVND